MTFQLAKYLHRVADSSPSSEEAENRDLGDKTARSKSRSLAARRSISHNWHPSLTKLCNSCMRWLLFDDHPAYLACPHFRERVYGGDHRARVAGYDS